MSENMPCDNEAEIASPPPSKSTESEKTTPTIPASTWMADAELVPKYSRWMSNKGVLYVAVRTIYEAEPGGCVKVVLLNVDREEDREMEFAEFKRWIETGLIKRKK